MKRKLHIAAAVAALALVQSPGASGPANAAPAGYKEKKLYDFCKKENCADGELAYGNVVIDSSRNIYGTTQYGGPGGGGEVFELTPYNNRYKFAVIYAFGVDDTFEDPRGDLSLDKDGNLYGTVDDESGCGVVFELDHDGGNWVFSLVHQFAGDSDGCLPSAGLTYAGKNLGEPWDEFSPLFGTTEEGGTYGNGVAYELIKDGSLWNETIIHTFEDERQPGALLEDSAGNLWGTTQYGGTSQGSDGIIFELAAETWKETIPFQFCSPPNCAAGFLPVGRLFMDGSGNIFGTTIEGGSSANCADQDGCGVVFELTAGGAYQVLYNFCSATDCADGSYPGGGVIMNASGLLVGTTGGGGSGQYAAQGGSGVAFELSNGGGSWSETVVHSFCSKPACKDGEYPSSDLVADSSGNIFGVTDGGKTSPGGNVFELKPR